MRCPTSRGCGGQRATRQQIVSATRQPNADGATNQRFARPATGEKIAAMTLPAQKQCLGHAHAPEVEPQRAMGEDVLGRPRETSLAPLTFRPYGANDRRQLRCSACELGKFGKSMVSVVLGARRVARANTGSGSGRQRSSERSAGGFRHAGGECPLAPSLRAIWVLKPSSLASSRRGTTTCASWRRAVRTLLGVQQWSAVIDAAARRDESVLCAAVPTSVPENEVSARPEEPEWTRHTGNGTAQAPS